LFGKRLFGKRLFGKRLFAKIVAGLVLIIVVLTISGAMFQKSCVRQDLQKYPARGELFEVSGRPMHLDCRGSGSPTVLLESGLLSSSVAWWLVMDDIVTDHQVCAYDRPELGGCCNQNFQPILDIP
tara:strand:- start:55145 stop:55522 length:378 start_codon:yes stop_codon:yes gene_type:complete